MVSRDSDTEPLDLNLGSTVKVLDMTDARTTAGTGEPEIVANHHAHYAGFSGISGVVAAASMTVGRDADARLAVRLGAPERGDVVVDIGCGPGHAARHVARLGPTVIGVEPARVMRRVARLLTWSRKVRYLDGTAEHVPVADHTATVVFAI